MHKNPVTWWELASTDAEKTVEFLKKAFDWDMEFNPNVANAGGLQSQGV